MYLLEKENLSLIVSRSEIWQILYSKTTTTLNFEITSRHLYINESVAFTFAVADRGFPVGGGDPLGAVDLRRGHFSAKVFAKMKELDIVARGYALARPLDLQ